MISGSSSIPGSPLPTAMKVRWHCTVEREIVESPVMCEELILGSAETILGTSRRSRHQHK